MECNRDEALRSREIAEKKFLAKDIVGAKKFALKAQNLYPDLNGISQLIATLDVHLSAETVLNGERDWYAILCVNALADEEVVKKQYRKLALMFHPDKNKCVGAEGAFKLISEAWSVLSDKNRRMAYDKKRNIKVARQKYSQHHGSNGFYNFANSAGVRTQKNTARSHTVPSAIPTPNHPSISNTFWTSCRHCKMQYEYLRVYLNHNLLCPSCLEPFLAVETGNPTNGPHTSVPCTSGHQQQNLNHNRNSHSQGRNASFASGKGNPAFQCGANLDAYNNSNVQWGAFSRTAGAASATASSTAAAHVANMVHQTYEKVRKEREEKQAAARRDGFVQKKSHDSNDTASTGYYNTTSCGSTFDRKHPQTSKEEKPAKKRRSISEDCLNYNGKAGMGSGYKNFSGTTALEVERANGGFGDGGKNRMMHGQVNSLSREISHFDIQNMLMQKAKWLIQKKLPYLTLTEASKLADKQKTKSQQKKKDSGEGKKTVVQGDVPEDIKMGNPDNPISQVPGKNASTDILSDDLENVEESVEIDVLDPDFHDFDIDRSERSFQPDQIWATYDNEDGMPRFYVLIQKVLSLESFKIRASYLNTKNNSEFGSLNWVGMGFSKTCGDFKVGGHRVVDSINRFSHRVSCDKVARGIVRIVPRKSDIWALYSNWCTDWNENTPDDVVHKYDMVEVLADYNDEQGVSVSPLTKVAGFKTVFHRQTDRKKVKRIPREEMFRFSHQVPSYFLTGEEASNAPKGCLELDPAATPLELLQVITEAKEE